jgi:hypothetical protein
MFTTGISQRHYKELNIMEKILILSTSPRKNGNSETLADGFMKDALEKGHSVEKTCLYDKNIGFCKGSLSDNQKMRYQRRHKRNRGKDAPCGYAGVGHTHLFL